MASDDEEFRLELENIDLRRLLAKAGIDAAEQEVARKVQRVLLEELHHRVKNNLATVQAIVFQSLRAAGSVEEGRRAIENRLSALARVHDLLLQTTWSKTKLAAIVTSAIEPFDTPSARQVFTRVSNFDVAPAAALPLAMVLNELCTNAAKYGALSSPKGRVDIDATVDDASKRFRLIWAERNGPAVVEPLRRSFGAKLIEHAFAAQLKGTASLKFNPAGVRYELEAPVATFQPQISN